MNTSSAPVLGVTLWALVSCHSGPADRASVAAEIRADNAFEVARATVTAIVDLESIGSLAELARALAPVATKGPAAPASPGSTDLCRSGTATPRAAWIAQPRANQASGLAIGITTTLELEECRLPSDLLLTGGIEIQTQRFGRRPQTNGVDYRVEMNLRNVDVVTANHSARANGDINLYADDTTYPFVYTAQSGRQLTLAGSSGSATLLNYELARRGVLERSTRRIGDVDRIYDGKLTSPTFAGEARFLTTLPLKTDSVEQTTPSQGQLEIYGARGATLRLSIGTNAVEIELDANGDSDFEYRQVTDWASLSTASQAAFQAR